MISIGYFELFLFLSIASEKNIYKQKLDFGDFLSPFAELFVYK